MKIAGMAVAGHHASLVGRGVWKRQQRLVDYSAPGAVPMRPFLLAFVRRHKRPSRRDIVRWFETPLVGAGTPAPFVVREIDLAIEAGELARCRGAMSRTGLTRKGGYYVYEMVTPTHQPLRVLLDEDCPLCGWPELVTIRNPKAHGRVLAIECVRTSEGNCTYRDTFELEQPDGCTCGRGNIDLDPKCPMHFLKISQSEHFPKE